MKLLPRKFSRSLLNPARRPSSAVRPYERVVIPQYPAFHKDQLVPAPAEQRFTLVHTWVRTAQGSTPIPCGRNVSCTICRRLPWPWPQGTLHDEVETKGAS